MKKELDKIQKPYLIFCEGMDEKMFLIYFLESEALKEIPFFSNEIQVMDFGGNDELRQKLEVLKLSPGFETIKALLIIRDAEKDAQGAVCQIKSSLEHVELPIPDGPGIWQGEKLKVGFLLFPSCAQEATEGTLEDLCLSILKQEDYSGKMSEISDFLECLKKENYTFTHEHKTKLHTYFSVTNEYVGMKVGEAARAGAFNWNDERLDFLKSFMLEIED